MPEIRIQEPLAHQQPVVDSSARYKLVRGGRRWGKTRVLLFCAIIGHGPDVRRGDRIEKMFRGIISGYDVAWIARDYKNGDQIWNEEIVPRFKGVPGVILNSSDRFVQIIGKGRLFQRSAENIDTVRGIGAKLAGVVVDEAAWLNLQYAIQKVLRPALMDNKGWLMLTSTTNAGPDGYVDESVGKRTPSYFNLLAQEILDGKRKTWEHFYGTAHDNPAIDNDEIEALIEEYTEGSADLEQEIYAKLLEAGAGVAFPEWNDDAHIVKTDPPPSWRVTGFGDWGYTKPGGLWLAGSGPERSVVFHEYYFTKTTPYEAAFNFGHQCMGYPSLPEWIVVDTPAVSDGGPTIIEELQRGLNDALRKFLPDDASFPAFVNPPKGPGSRQTGKTLVHQALRYQRAPDGKGGEVIPLWGMPAVQFHTRCPNMTRTLQRLPKDPKGKDDVDTEAEDHPYDGFRGWLMARIPTQERERIVNHDPDQHPGIEDGKRKHEESPWVKVIRDQPDGHYDEPRWSRIPAGYEQ